MAQLGSHLFMWLIWFTKYNENRLWLTFFGRTMYPPSITRTLIQPNSLFTLTETSRDSDVFIYSRLYNVLQANFPITTLADSHWIDAFLIFTNVRSFWSYTFWSAKHKSCLPPKQRNCHFDHFLTYSDFAILVGGWNWLMRSFLWD